MTSLEYERWKRHYRRTHDPFDPEPWGDVPFDDVGLYRAFLMPDGVDSEVLFAFPPLDAEYARERLRTLLELSDRALAEFPALPQRSYRPVVVEILHQTPGHPSLSAGWHGAPEAAPGVGLSEFVRRARADIARRLDDPGA